MKKLALITLICLFCFSSFTSLAMAHFGMIIPSDDIVTNEDASTITLDIQFIHPMENHYMDMEKPEAFGVLIRDKKTSLLPLLKENKVKGHTTWQVKYQVKRPGDHIFYVEPKPYWEPAEDCFIIHYTKVIVNALGMEDAWDKELGIKTEIIPLTRPYGLWTGNIFRGIVKVNGKPAPYSEVEVEYYNKANDVKAPTDSHITQVVKADANGVFCYAIPKAGWWGFAALNEDEKKIKKDGVMKSIEIGAVLWIKAIDMK